MNQPCYGCTERYSECHSTCKEYRDWKADLESKKAIINKKKQEEKKWTEYKFATHKRFSNRNGKKV